jgi:hypothetical protein
MDSDVLIEGGRETPAFLTWLQLQEELMAGICFLRARPYSAMRG